jgi:hypothetical protein
VQVDPIKPRLKAPGHTRLKLKCDELLSNFAFNFNLRRYNEGLATPGVTAVGLLANTCDAGDKFKTYLQLVDEQATPGLEDKEWRNPATKTGWGRVGI